VIVGDMKGPHLFDILELIGKEESIQRIKNAISALAN
jgi:glutamyl-tRNA synthetase